MVPTKNQTTIISLYSIRRLGFVICTGCVNCEVRTEYLYQREPPNASVTAADGFTTYSSWSRAPNRARGKTERVTDLLLCRVTWNWTQCSKRLGGVATRYGLDGPVFEILWWRVFPDSSRPARKPTQPNVHWVPGLFPEVKRSGCSVDHPTPSSAEFSMGSAISLPPLSACLAC